MAIRLKKVIHRTIEQAGEGGKQGNVGVPLFPFPFGNRLRRYPHQLGEICLGEVVLSAVFLNKWGNVDSAHSATQ